MGPVMSSENLNPYIFAFLMGFAHKGVCKYFPNGIRSKWCQNWNQFDDESEVEFDIEFEVKFDVETNVNFDIEFDVEFDVGFEANVMSNLTLNSTSKVSNLDLKILGCNNFMNWIQDAAE